MKKELQEKLFEKYPKIFVEKDLPMSQTCMCWGIDTGNGWYDILDVLCSSLQWDTDKNGRPQVVATQVKEKFGTLRFYTHGADDHQEGMISLTENLSAITCEVCGKKAETARDVGGWVSTLCDECKICNECENYEEEADDNKRET